MTAVRLRPYSNRLNQTYYASLGEKQAIDATLQSIAKEDSRFCPIADKYWNARGGSSTDGGAFTFTIKDSGKADGSKTLITQNKFGEMVKTPEGQVHYDVCADISSFHENERLTKKIIQLFNSTDLAALKQF